MKKSTIFVLIVFIILVIFLRFSGIPERLNNKKCCEFLKSEIDGTLSYVDISKSGNFFKIESIPNKNFLFQNKGNYGKRNDIKFDQNVKVGFRIVKKSYSDTLIVFGLNNEKHLFEIVQCCKD